MRKWRGDRERKRKWRERENKEIERENSERMRKWRCNGEKEKTWRGRVSHALRVAKCQIFYTDENLSSKFYPKHA